MHASVALALISGLMVVGAGPPQASAANGGAIALGGSLYPLAGLDAPALVQHCRDGSGRLYGCEARAASNLSAWLAARTVVCRAAGKTQDGTRAFRCEADGKDVGRRVVRSGWALAYGRGGGPDYGAEERLARRDRVGLWSGTFLAPSVWRRSIASRVPVASAGVVERR